MARITKRAVDALGNGPITLWDADLKGFGLRITASGVKTYVVTYRPHPGGRTAPNLDRHLTDREDFRRNNSDALAEWRQIAA